jgi:hypothetical protein
MWIAFFGRAGDGKPLGNLVEVDEEIAQPHIGEGPVELVLADLLQGHCLTVDEVDETVLGLRPVTLVTLGGVDPHQSDFEIP